MEKKDIWKEGFLNNKTFILYTNDTKFYINGCNKCDKIVKVTNLFKERQLVGNCYQSLCNCSECGNYMVYDEHKITTLDFYFNNINLINTEHRKNVKIGKHINIFSKELDSDVVKPIEIITDFEPYTYEHFHGKFIIDKLYVYISQSNTDDLFDNPLRNNQINHHTNYHAIICMKRNKLYYESYENNIIVKNILNKYYNL